MTGNELCVYLIHEPPERHNYSPVVYKDVIIISSVGSVHQL